MARGSRRSSTPWPGWRRAAPRASGWRASRWAARAPILAGMLFDKLGRLRREEHLAVLLAEQYATHALRLADLVYILKRGQLVWAGEPAELRASKVLVEAYLGAEL